MYIIAYMLDSMIYICFSYFHANTFSFYLASYYIPLGPGEKCVQMNILSIGTEYGLMPFGHRTIIWTSGDILA